MDAPVKDGMTPEEMRAYMAEHNVLPLIHQSLNTAVRAQATNPLLHMARTLRSRATSRRAAASRKEQLPRTADAAAEPTEAYDTAVASQQPLTTSDGSRLNRISDVHTEEQLREVRRALIEADPCWTWEPMGRDANGQPVLERDDAGRPVGLWIWGTVCGVTRPAYGSCDAGKREATKELIGDAIRNLALRFGVAGSLWSRADRGGDDATKPARRKAAKPRSVTDLPVDTTGLPEPAPGTAEFQALALLAPAASAADLAAVLKAEGIEGRGALTDQATLDRARAAVVAKWPA